MKALLFAGALSVSALAFAQDAQQPAPSSQGSQTDAANQDMDATQSTETQTDTQPSGVTVDDPSQATGPQGITQQGTDPSGQATAPAGTNQAPAGGGMAVPAPGQGAAFTPRPAAGEYPPCTRTVTDNCVQTYERGNRRSRPRR
jgi:hypothetical protein